MAVNTIRFSGLASGLDTESLVKSMMMSHQNKIDSQKKNETLISWKKDGWKDLNNKINTFYSQYVDKLRLQTTFGQSKVTVSNSNALDVDTTSSIPQGMHEISIKNIASGAYMKNKEMTGKVTVTEGTTLKDLGIESSTKIAVEKLDADGKPVGSGEPITIELTPDMNFEEVKKELQKKGISLSINTDTNTNTNKIEIGASGSGAASVNLTVINANTDSNGEFMGDSKLFEKLGFASSSITIKEGEKAESKDFRTTVIDKNTKLSLLGINSGRITVKGTDIVLAEVETIGQLETKIKEADKDLNVNFDVTNKRFFISSKETGAKAAIEISATPTDLLEKLGLSHDSSSTQSGDPSTLVGQNAKYTYNGMSFESESNMVTINGIKMTFKDKTSEPIQISAMKDPTAISDFVKEFVQEYNKLIDEINTKVGAKKSYSYAPLTDEQKKEMTEDDVKAWEAKVKAGMFSGDAQMRNISSTLRDILGSTVEGGDIKVLSQIGITTGSWKEQGKLVFDEKKFKEAMEKDSDGVINLFTAKGDTGDTENTKGTKGIATKLYDELSKLMKSSGNKSYGTFYNDKVLDEDLKETQKKIQDLQDKYVTLENSYYAKFTAMEKMMSQLNNQSSWLSSQLGGM